MAEPITIAQLIDASEDAQTLSSFVNADSATQVPRRLADPIETLEYWRNYMSNLTKGADGVSATIDLTATTGAAGTQVGVVTGGTPTARTFALTIPRGDKGIDGSFTQKAYTTYALMTADAANIPAQTSVNVTNDTDTTKNGLYTYNGTTFTKSAYDPVALAATDATTKANNAKTQAVADTLLKVQNVFATKALMTASTLPDGSNAQVNNDTTATNNGFYKKGGGVWSATLYDPSLQSKKYVDELVAPSLEYILNRVDVGTSLNVDFSNGVNGDLATTVGNPAMTSSGLVFTVQSGYAVSPAGAAKATPAALWHKHNDASAIMRASISTATQTDSQAGANGLAVQRRLDTATDGCAFMYKRESGTLLYARMTGASVVVISSTVLSLPLNVTDWVMEVELLDGGRRHSCVIELPDGTRSTPYIVERYINTSSSPYLPMFGILATAPNFRVKSVVIDTTRSVVKQDIDNIVESQKFPTSVPLTGERTAKNHIVQNGKGFEQDFSKTEAILIDDFDSPNGTVFPSAHTPNYKNLEFGAIDYGLFGTAEWQVQDSSVMLAKGGVGTPVATYGLAGFDAKLPTGWYQWSRGFELRAKVFVPEGDCTVGVAMRYPDGTTATDGAGAIVIKRSSGALLMTTHPDVAGGSNYASEEYYRQIFSPKSVMGRDIDIVVRCYNSNGRGDTHDMIIAEVDGDRIAKFFYKPTDVDPRRSNLRNITSVGIGVDTLSTDCFEVKVKEFSISPVPRAGSSFYRSLPPEPAPVVPQFSPAELVFDMDDAHSEAQTGLAGILGPSILPMIDFKDRLGLTAIDDYYIYYSSNHTGTEGGIWLATAPTPTGPWTRYDGTAGSKRIYVDTSSGKQTEQPQVVYDEQENRLIMIYHNRDALPSNTQVSMTAVSADGVNWTRVGVSADTSKDVRQSFSQHDGYSSFCAKDPLGIVSGWIGWWRLTGGAGSIGGIASLWSTARSKDGITWTTDLLPIAIPSLKRPQHEQNVLHNMGCGAVPFEYLGQRLFPIAPFKSVEVGIGEGYIAIVRMGDDMRNMSAEEYVIEKTLTTEAGTNTISSVFVRGNILYLYYTSRAKFVHLITADLSKPPKGVTRTLD